MNNYEKKIYKKYIYFHEIQKLYMCIFLLVISMEYTFELVKNRTRKCCDFWKYLGPRVFMHGSILSHILKTIFKGILLIFHNIIFW